MILVIDNYDSFVHNLARYFRQLGCETLVLRNDVLDVAQIETISPQAIVLSPGPCTPADAGCCLDVVKHFGERFPILGICLGHQALVQALGGSIVRANEPVHGRQSEVFHDGSAIFDQVKSPFLAGRYHSLVAQKTGLPAELIVTAKTSDGTIMAVEHKTWPMIGLQFHPELILTDSGYQMLMNFLKLAGIANLDPACLPGQPNCAMRIRKSHRTFSNRIGSADPTGCLMILEALVTTINEDGSTNLSPMGPTVNDGLSTFELRPFNTSRTFANLKRTRMGVLHVTDDVELFARSAIGRLIEMPTLIDAEKVAGKIIANACRYHEFKVEFMDETGPRMSLNCRTVASNRIRDFWGFNRAKHAVLEAAILATRLDFLPASEIASQFVRLQTIVEKTGGVQEKNAFSLLSEFVGHEQGNPSSA